jgi:MerR family transcriptional regulator, light-induced transcriptional regulator
MGDRRKNDSHESHEAKVSEAGRAYAAALLSGDEIAAEIAIREAIDANLTTAEIDDEIIAPALWLVGDLWQRGQISVADEHIATEISIRVLALQREAQRVARARSDHRVMLAAPAGELHIVALRMVANLLRDAGYDTVMLGADVPTDALGASARRHRPDVVCLSSTMPGAADQLLTSIDEVRREWPGAGFVIGGRGLMRRAQSRSRIDVCGRVSEVVEAVDAMVKRAGLN